MRDASSPDGAGFFGRASWTCASSSVRDAAQKALVLFLGLAGLQFLLWAVFSAALEWTEILQAALLAVGLGVVDWAAPRLRRLLATISPEPLRVTVTALLLAAGFVILAGVMTVGEPGGLQAFLDGWPLWLGLFLPMGFVLAISGALEESDGRTG